MVELEAPTSDRDSSKPRVQARLGTERPDWHDHVKPHENELRGNMARPQLLYELAKVYFGGYLNVRGNSPRDRLNALLAGDEGLVDAVLSGFRKTIDRDDLPSDTKVIHLGIANRTHYLALPFMAGLEEMAKTAPSGQIDIDQRRLRLAQAVHYTVPMWPTVRHPADRPPRWFAWTLSNHPEIAADVLVRSVLSKLRRGAESPAGIHELAHSPDHARVARLASMPLLRQFPVRGASGQLSSLNHLLLAARRHCDIDPLLALIDEKHADHRMSVAQRVHWLVAGLCIAPESYVGRLESYAAGRERRIRFLAEAVTRQFGVSPDVKCRRSAPALRLLIQLIGASCRPYSLGDDSDEGVMVTPEMNAAERVRDCIEQLASVSTEDASRALQALSSDDDLGPWHSLLMDAAYRQEAARREAEFAYGDIAQVIETLASGPPANVGRPCGVDLGTPERDCTHHSRRQYVRLEAILECRSSQPPTESSPGRRLPRCAVIGSAEQVDATRYRSSAGRTLRQRQAGRHSCFLRWFQCSRGDQKKLPSRSLECSTIAVDCSLYRRPGNGRTWHLSCIVVWRHGGLPTHPAGDGITGS